MSKVIPFKKPSLQKKHRGKTLCKHGHHKWEIVTSSKFDVKQGRLVSVFRCSRCQQEKTKAT